MKILNLKVLNSGAVLATVDDNGVKRVYESNQKLFFGLSSYDILADRNIRISGYSSSLYPSGCFKGIINKDGSISGNYLSSYTGKQLAHELSFEFFNITRVNKKTILSLAVLYDGELTNIANIEFEGENVVVKKCEQKNFNVNECFNSIKSRPIFRCKSFEYFNNEDNSLSFGYFPLSFFVNDLYGVISLKQIITLGEIKNPSLEYSLIKDEFYYATKKLALFSKSTKTRYYKALSDYDKYSSYLSNVYSPKKKPTVDIANILAALNIIKYFEMDEPTSRKFFKKFKSYQQFGGYISCCFSADKYKKEFLAFILSNVNKVKSIKDYAYTFSNYIQNGNKETDISFFEKTTINSLKRLVTKQNVEISKKEFQKDKANYDEFYKNNYKFLSGERNNERIELASSEDIINLFKLTNSSASHFDTSICLHFKYKNCIFVVYLGGNKKIMYLGVYENNCSHTLNTTNIPDEMKLNINIFVNSIVKKFLASYGSNFKMYTLILRATISCV